jgi:hypothetical protein
LNYQVRLTLTGEYDSAPPLLSGPAPALAVHFSQVQDTSSTIMPAPSTPTSTSTGAVGAGQTAPALATTGLMPGGLADLGDSPVGGVASLARAPGSPAVVQLALGSPAAPAQGSPLAVLVLASIESLIVSPLGASTPEPGQGYIHLAELDKGFPGDPFAAVESAPEASNALLNDLPGGLHATQESAGVHEPAALASRVSARVGMDRAADGTTVASVAGELAVTGLRRRGKLHANEASSENASYASWGLAIGARVLTPVALLFTLSQAQRAGWRLPRHKRRTVAAAGSRRIRQEPASSRSGSTRHWSPPTAGDPRRLSRVSPPVMRLP